MGCVQMKLFGTMRINGKGHLEIGGCDAIDLAGTFGTPLYVMDEDFLRQTCRDYHKAMIESIPGGEVAFACKAFCCTSMIRIAMQEDLGIDVVSGGELHTALAAGADKARINFHGNNKTPAELRYALENEIGRIVVDNNTEIHMLEEIAASLGRKQKVLLRVQPGIESHTHAYVQTGKVDSKFGLSIATGQALEAIRTMTQMQHIEVCGLHCHIGSQIHEEEAFIQTARIMASFLASIRDGIGIQLDELNLGGGLGVYYQEEDQVLSPESYVNAIYQTLQEEFMGFHFPMPKRLSIEPGRSIVANAGTTLYTVGSLKTIPGIRTYVAVDGGMTDNPRQALYQAKYEMALANKMNEPATVLASVAGKCCESGDMLIWDAYMADVETGDILAVASTGAYNYSMASNYNRLPKPPVILVSGGQAHVIVERESYEDLIRYDRIPQHLRS